MNQRQKIFRVRRVVQRIVGGAVVIGADSRYIEKFDNRAPVGCRCVRGSGVPAHDHLVPLGRTVGVGDVEQHEVEVVTQRNDNGGLRG